MKQGKQQHHRCRATANAVGAACHCCACNSTCLSMACAEPAPAWTQSPGTDCRQRIHCAARTRGMTGSSAGLEKGRARGLHLLPPSSEILLPLSTMRPAYRPRRARFSRLRPTAAADMTPQPSSQVRPLWQQCPGGAPLLAAAGGGHSGVAHGHAATRLHSLERRSATSAPDEGCDVHLAIVLSPLLRRKPSEGARA